MTVGRRAPLSPRPGTPVSLHATRRPATVRSVRDALLYLCTDARRERGDLAEFADAALAGGVDVIQLRDKGSAGERKFGPLEARAELAALEVLADAARRHDALIAVNDRADIARAAGADVLHLGQDDLPLPVAREIFDRDAIGRSTHDRRPGARRGRRGPGAGLLLRRSVLADPDQTRPARSGPGPGPRGRRSGDGEALVRDRRDRRGPASRGASRPARAARWWSGPSPRPTTRRPRPSS